MDEIAKELGRRKKVKVLKALDKKSAVEDLKNVHDPNKRRTLLEHNIFYSLEFELPGKRVLLIDDVFRSGTTLSVATGILYKRAKVDSLLVLTMTMTKTRSKS